LRRVLFLQEPGYFFQDPQRISELLNQADKQAWCIIMSIVALVVGYLLLLPTLFALEVNGQIDISWVFVFMPLWVVYGLVFLVLLTGAPCVSAHRDRFFKKKNARPPSPSPFASALDD
jgi:fatty acid desaturase